MQSNCKKCDDRGMIQDDKYSAHSCPCGKSNRIMEEKFKDVSIEDLLAYGRLRVKEKNFSAVALGSIKSKKKAKSSRLNGKKGGRPRIINLSGDNTKTYVKKIQIMF